MLDEDNTTDNNESNPADASPVIEGAAPAKKAPAKKAVAKKTAAKKTAAKKAPAKKAAAKKTPAADVPADEAETLPLAVDTPTAPGAPVVTKSAPRKRTTKKTAATPVVTEAPVQDEPGAVPPTLLFQPPEPVKATTTRRTRKTVTMPAADALEPAEAGVEAAADSAASPEPAAGDTSERPTVTRTTRGSRSRRPAGASASAEAGAPGEAAESADAATTSDTAADATSEAASEPRSGSRTRSRSGSRAAAADRADDRAADDAPEGRDDSEETDETDDTDESGAPRRRRRRGGRRRRKSGDGDDSGEATSGSDDSSDQADAGESSGDNQGSGDSRRGGNRGERASDDSSESGEGAGSRRRRRRRRTGDDGNDGGDDPDNTVTRVRSRRSAEDQITAVAGSTRLEAKKQRRREGREAGRRRAPIVSEAEFLARRESVDRVMVIRQRDDLSQIAVLEDKVLVEHYVARESQTSLIGNVYVGRVQNVLPSMEAAFIDIGKGRNAVLYAGEVNWSALGHKDGQPRKIESVLSSGQSILVQVTKDPIGHKGARLTSQVSLAGRFLVYVPDGTTSGISRKLPDTERGRLKALLKEIVPDTAGVIVRTAAEGASEEELTRDVERLKARWEDIEKNSKSGGSPKLLYGEPDLTLKVVRDLFTEDFAKLVIEGDDAWETVQQYVVHVAPDLESRLERYDAGQSGRDSFSAYRIDEQIAKGMDRKVWLPSGGSLIIDRTEAMTVVDVNTGKFTGSGGNLEETVTKNNLEAAEEMVRQLRLRDIGGIIVIDFIDMVLESNRDLVLRRLVECLGRDRTRHQVAEVTSLGLVQMTRKRIGTGLLEAFSENCNHCQGRGLVVHETPIEPRNADDDSRRGGRRGRGRGRDDGDDNATSSNGGGGRSTPSPKVLAGSHPPAEPEAEPEAPQPEPEQPTEQPGEQPAEQPAEHPSGRRPTRSRRRGATPVEQPATDSAPLTDEQPTDEPQVEQVTPPVEPAKGLDQDEEPAAQHAGETAAVTPEPAPEPAPEPEPEVKAPAVVTRTRRRSASRPAGPPVAVPLMSAPSQQHLTVGTIGSPSTDGMVEPAVADLEPGSDSRAATEAT